jgi:hypothetical protein
LTNGAATRFAQPKAIGNNRPRPPAIYSGALTGNFGDSGWNAQPYGFGATAGPTPNYSDAQLGFSIGGPVKLPFTRLWVQQVRASFQHNLQHNTTTRLALVPTDAQRLGDLSSFAGVIRDPQTGLPFPGNVIPAERIAPEATALLALYPLPTGPLSTGANFQRTLLNSSDSDRVQVDASHNLGRRMQLSASLVYSRSASDAASLFDFVDNTRQNGLNVTAGVVRRQTTRLNLQATYQFARSNSTVTPFFANRLDVSGAAGISGGAVDPRNWGPPTLAFPDVVELSDGRYQRGTRQSHTIGGQAQWRHGLHNISFGGDARLNTIDSFAQPDPRGTLNFTGAATGNAFADFLLGFPATSSIGFLNTSTRIRGHVVDAFFDDDMRVLPELTIDLGVRWEYESPYREQDAHLANLDVAPGFTAASIVTGEHPIGDLTGTTHPASLVHPDPLGIEPRVSLAWRPVLTSSLVIKAGYGMYRNLGVYQSIGGTARAAAAVPAQLQCAEHAGHAADAGESVPAIDPQYDDVRGRSELPRGDAPLVAGDGATRLPRLDDRRPGLSRRPWDAAAAGVSAEHVRAWRDQCVRDLSVRVHVSDVGRLVQQARHATHRAPPAVRRFHGDGDLYAGQGHGQRGDVQQYERRARIARRRAELARPRGRARAIVVRSAASPRGRSAIHDRRRHSRRHARRRLLGLAL